MEEDHYSLDIKVSLDDEVKMGNDILKSYQSQYTETVSTDFDVARARVLR